MLVDWGKSKKDERALHSLLIIIIIIKKWWFFFYSTLFHYKKIAWISLHQLIKSHHLWKTVRQQKGKKNFILYVPTTYLPKIKNVVGMLKCTYPLVYFTYMPTFNAAKVDFLSDFFVCWINANNIICTYLLVVEWNAHGIVKCTKNLDVLLTKMMIMMNLVRDA